MVPALLFNFPQNLGKKSIFLLAAVVGFRRPLDYFTKATQIPIPDHRFYLSLSWKNNQILTISLVLLYLPIGVRRIVNINFGSGFFHNFYNKICGKFNLVDKVSQLESNLIAIGGE